MNSIQRYIGQYDGYAQLYRNSEGKARTSLAFHMRWLDKLLGEFERHNIDSQTPTLAEMGVF